MGHSSNIPTVRTRLFALVLAMAAQVGCEVRETILDAACTTANDCPSGNVCEAGSCALVVDDFSGTSLDTNTMGGWVFGENQTIKKVAGELRFVWDGRSSVQYFIESFIPNYCAFDLRPYRTLRFRMRSGAGTRIVPVLLARSLQSCRNDEEPMLRAITVTPTMTTYEIDLSGQTRDKALFVSISPPTDDTEYVIDDMHLVP